MSTDGSMFDRTLGILVILYGTIHLLGVAGVLEPRLVSVIVPILIVLAGIKITISDMR